jgi:hypothetical protein
MYENQRARGKTKGMRRHVGDPGNFTKAQTLKSAAKEEIK